jgi:predicted metal-dependent peptidase
MSEDGGDFAALEEAAARQAAEEAAAAALGRARARFILGRDARSAFFATLVLRLKARPDWTEPTLATDGRELRYNPEFLRGLPAAEAQGVLAHEALHCALGHPARRGGRDPVLWNVACDLAVNPILLDAGMSLPAGRLVPGDGKFAQLPAGKSAEEYYSILRRGQDEPGDDSGNGGGTGESQGSPVADPGGCGRVEDRNQADPAACRALEADWQVALAQAERAGRGRGELPGGLGRAAQEILHPPLDWKAVLREFLSAHARNDYSWSRPNRRFLAQGLYLPGLHSEELGDVVLAVDTSGSIGEELLGVFAAEANAVLSAYDCCVTVLYHDTEIQKVQTWHSSDGPLKLEPVGGGGTSHACVFDWLERSRLRPACVVCLTDLETEFPSVDPSVPVLWAVAGSTTRAPFGRVVPIPL